MVVINLSKNLILPCDMLSYICNAILSDSFHFPSIPHNTTTSSISHQSSRNNNLASKRRLQPRRQPLSTHPVHSRRLHYPSPLPNQRKMRICNNKMKKRRKRRQMKRVKNKNKSQRANERKNMGASFAPTHCRVFIMVSKLVFCAVKGCEFSWPVTRDTRAAVEKVLTGAGVNPAMLFFFFLSAAGGGE